MSRGASILLGVPLDPGVLQDLGQGQLARGLIFEQLENQVPTSEGIDRGTSTSTLEDSLGGLSA